MTKRKLILTGIVIFIIMTVVNVVAVHNAKVRSASVAVIGGADGPTSIVVTDEK